MAFFYTIGIFFLGLGIRIASLFSQKARQWIGGRQHLFDELHVSLEQKDRWIWFHAASLGEFEQGRPLIELVKANHPDRGILLTFFSPSGYEVRKKYPYADIVRYMPLDTPANARRFVSLVKPELAVFIKYELWYHHLKELERFGTPTLLISAQFRPGQAYFRSYGRFFLPLLKRLRHIFLADANSEIPLVSHGFDNFETTGDTRIDQVVSTSRSHTDFSFLRNTLDTSDDIWVLGSTWPGDEKLVIPLINSRDIPSIIAPHELDESHLLKIERALEIPHCRLSAITDKTRARVIIVDTMGDLAHLYHLGAIAYVGGGFESGIHNILEAAVYGAPVIFGPDYHDFAEAHALIDRGVCASVTSYRELEEAFDRMTSMQFKEKTAIVLHNYFQSHEGATAQIYDYICRERLLNGLEG